MEKSSIVNSSAGNKKIFIRKEIEASRLGKCVYEDDILSQYTVYLVRKFEQGTDYDSNEQFDLLLTLLPEEFNTYFEHFVLKKMYIRATSKTVYISLLLALASPLAKAQMNELREWMSDLIIPEISLEHTSNFIDQGNPIDVTRSLQETNSEVLLLSEMMNQFSQNLTEVFNDVKHLKEKKAPPVVKVVPSEALAKQSIETENSQRINKLSQKIEQLTTDFANFKVDVTEKVTLASKRRKPPKFKIVLGTGSEGQLTLESRLELAIDKVNSLTKEIQDANRKIAILDNKVIEARNLKRPKITFSKAIKTSNEATVFEAKLATTTQEISILSKQIQQVSDKLNTVETNVLEKKPDQEIVARIEKDRGKIQENASETIRLTEIIGQLKDKLQTVESQLVTVKEEQEQAPTVEVVEKTSVEDLTKQHNKDQELLKINATEIKKLTQTVSKVDVQLIQAHQKIAELEQKMRSATKYEQQLKEVAVQQAQMSAIQGPKDVPRPQPVQVQQQTRIAPSTSIVSEGMDRTRNFPSKESFLQSIKQTGNNTAKTLSVVTEPQPQPQPGMTLAIEEVLDRVSEKHPNPVYTNRANYIQPAETANQQRTSNLRQLKKLEWDIHAIFNRDIGIGHRGMVAKETFRTNLKKMDVLPYLWNSVYKKEQRDILLGNDLSCQRLINELNDFLEETKHFAQKRKVMGKWVYCPKEVEQKMEGYKLLNDYLELYLER